MQVFKCFGPLTMVLVLVGAKSDSERRMEPRVSNYIPPGDYKIFRSEDSFASASASQISQYETDSRTTLWVSCLAKLPCEKSSFLVAIGTDKDLLGYQCSEDSTQTMLPRMETGSKVTLIAYSGSTSDGEFYCMVFSNALPQTTTIVSNSTTSTTFAPSSTSPATTTYITDNSTTIGSSTASHTTIALNTTSRTTIALNTTSRTPMASSTTNIPFTDSYTTSKPVVTSSSADCQCGTIGGPKIVGGEDVTEGEIPWQAALGTKRKYWFSAFCGGTLISANYVLTAAHCLKPVNFTSYKIFLGSVDRSSSNGVVVDLAEVIPHEQYHNKDKINDILLLKLASSVKFSSTVFPACLPRKFTGETFSGKDMVISGWGIIKSSSENLPDIMLKATVVGITNEKCNEQYNYLKKITPGMLCAQAPGKDSCKGDSGGPLTYTETGVTYLAGVVSFGISCGMKYFAGVYTRVTSYLDWIDNKIGTPLCSK